VNVTSLHLVQHGLAVKRNGTIEAIAGITGLDSAVVRTVIGDLLKSGRAVEVRGSFVLTPAARVALQSDYSRFYGSLRSDARFLALHESFERVNGTLKAVITDWQTVPVRGERVPNHHADADYDRKVIDRLGDVHDQAEPILGGLAERVSRMRVYQDKLLEALEKTEDGAIEWVSDARIESYHTVWFELHEDLLRLVGRSRVE
jgi:hypothetical protein